MPQTFDKFPIADSKPIEKDRIKNFLTGFIQGGPSLIEILLQHWYQNSESLMIVYSLPL